MVLKTRTVVLKTRIVVLKTRTVVLKTRTVVLKTRTVVLKTRTVVLKTRTVVLNEKGRCIMKTTTSPLGRGKITHDNLFNIQGNFVNVTVSYAVAWGIPPADVAALVAERAIYEPLYQKVQIKNTRTKADVAAHKLGAERYLEILRRFWNKWIEDGDMPTEEKLFLGGELLDTEPSPGPVITDTPYLAVRTAGRGKVEVRAQTTEDATRASMPAFAKLVECRYVILEQGDIPPDHPDNFPKKELSSRAKFILPVGEQNAGKRLHLVARWVNTAKPKQEGPWTDALSVTIA